VDVFDGELDVALDPIIDELDDRLDDLVDDIQEEIDRAVADIDVPGLEDIEVDVGGSLFAVNEDFVELLAAALDEVDFVEIDEFGDIEGLIEDVEGFLEEVRPLLDLTAEDLIDRATEEAEAFLEDLPGGQILLDPDQFIDDQIDRVTDGLVSEDVRQDLQDTIEDL